MTQAERSEDTSSVARERRMLDPWNTTIHGNTLAAIASRIVIDFDVESDTSSVVGHILDRNGDILVECHRAWSGIRRGLAVDSARLLARELELYLDPF